MAGICKFCIAFSAVSEIGSRRLTNRVNALGSGQLIKAKKGKFAKAALDGLL